MGHSKGYVQDGQYNTNTVALEPTLQFGKEGDNVHDHSMKMKVVRDWLVAIGHWVDSVELALMVLHWLPRSYRGFMTTVLVDERSKL